MTLFENIVTKSNDEADEPAKDGATLDGGETTQIRTKTVQQKRQDVYATGSTQVAFIVWWRSDMIAKRINRRRSLWTTKKD